MRARAFTLALTLTLTLIACSDSKNKRSTPEPTSAVTTTDALAADPDDPWAPKPPADAPADRLLCERLDFAASLPIAEASGAAHTPAAGDRAAYLLVVGDSGNVGEYLEVDPESGAVLRRGHLPLDKGASDDLEGLARVGDTFYSITSSGYVRHHERNADGAYTLTVPAYPIGAPPATCAKSTQVNCGRNYEGLCLVDEPAGAGAQCAGFAVSKTEGALYCLVFIERELHITDAPPIRIANPDELTGCSFAGASFVWVGANMFGGNAVYRVRDWATPANARIDKVGADGPGFSEAIAAGPGNVVYRLSDDSGAPSLAEKYVCE